MQLFIFARNEQIFFQSAAVLSTQCELYKNNINGKIKNGKLKTNLSGIFISFISCPEAVGHVAAECYFVWAPHDSIVLKGSKRTKEQRFDLC